MVASAPRDIPYYQAARGGVPEDFLISGETDGDYMYYRQPNGWLTIGHVGKNHAQMHRYQDEGWTPLRDYGTVDFLKPYYLEHPFEVLFMRGGAHEMSIEQIRALGYDRRPPIVPRCNLALGNEHNGPTRRPLHFARCMQGARPVVFPQLEGVTPVEVPNCEFCDRDDFASLKGLNQHMRVVHADELREISTAREMGKSMQDALRAVGITASNGAAAGVLSNPFRCGLCSETFPRTRGRDPSTSLEAHIRLHGDAPASSVDDDSE